MKQVDLQAKFASLLKQSNANAREKLLGAGASQQTKQDKKGEKREQAAAARSQLFGEAG